MSTLDDKTVDALVKLEALTSKYEPDAIAVAGASNIATAVAGLIFMYLVGFATWKLANLFLSKEKVGGDWGARKLSYAITIGVGGIVCVTLAISSVLELLDVWNWVAIFNPKLAMAHKILGL